MGHHRESIGNTTVTLNNVFNYNVDRVHLVIIQIQQLKPQSSAQILVLKPLLDKDLSNPATHAPVECVLSPVEWTYLDASNTMLAFLQHITFTSVLCKICS